MIPMRFMEIFLRTIPEDLLFVLAVYIFTNTKIDKKKYIISSLVLGIAIYFVRLLPLHFGIHTIISIVYHVVFLTWYNRIEFSKAFSSVLAVFISLIVGEWINLQLLLKVFHIQSDELSRILVEEPVLKIIYTLPSLIFLALIIGIVFFVKKAYVRSKANVSG